MRMSIRRFTRDSNGHSKKFQNHVLHYNFCRVHMTLGTTPAVAAGLATEPYPLDWLVGLMDTREPNKRWGPYRARQNPCISN